MVGVVMWVAIGVVAIVAWRLGSGVVHHFLDLKEEAAHQKSLQVRAIGFAAGAVVALLGTVSILAGRLLRRSTRS